MLLIIIVDFLYIYHQKMYLQTKPFEKVGFFVKKLLFSKELNKALFLFLLIFL